MCIDVFDEKRRIDVWITGAEAADSRVGDEIGSLITRCKGRNYTVVVFVSGDRDVTEMTGLLLKAEHPVAGKPHPSSPAPVTGLDNFSA